MAGNALLPVLSAHTGWRLVDYTHLLLLRQPPLCSRRLQLPSSRLPPRRLLTDWIRVGRKLHIGEDKKRRLLAQIKKDCALLERLEVRRPYPPVPTSQGNPRLRRLSLALARGGGAAVGATGD